jgi:phosphoribosylamine---glycine ligase
MRQTHDTERTVIVDVPNATGSKSENMRILIIDSWNGCLDFAMRCNDAGHSCIWYQRPRKDGQKIRVGEGLVETTSDFSKLPRLLEWCDLCFLPENTHYTEFLQPYFDKGYPIFGANAEAAHLELDRTAGQEAFRKAGLKIIEGKEFHDYDQAAAYVKKLGIACVSKPSGDADKNLSYVADDAASMLYMMLDRWKKKEKMRVDARKYGFIVQDKIEGCEMGVAGWFGPGGWSQWWEENFEYKKFMDGDLGPTTGEMGTLIRYVKKSKLASAVLLPCTEILEKIGYVGNASINCIIQKDGTPRPMEWTLRPGWPAFHNHISLTEGDPAKWMGDLLDGHDTLQVKKDGLLSVSIVYTIPPHPRPEVPLDEVVGIPIYHATDREHIHPVEMMVDDCWVQVGDVHIHAPNYATAGDYVLVVTGTGETVSGARLSAYSAARKVKMPIKAQFRWDIGRGRLVEQLPVIQAMGYATGIEW